MKVNKKKSKLVEAPKKKTAPADPTKAVPAEHVPGTNTDKQEVPADDTRINGGIIETRLDFALKRALLSKHAGTQREDLWFLGPAGTGKTERIYYWADGHNYKGMKLNVVQWTTAVKSPTDMSGLLFKGEKEITDQETGETKTVDRAMTLAFEFFDKLDEPNTVLFLDEYNAGSFFTRNALMKLYNEHAIEDNAGNKRYFKNLLFTVVATNKATGNYGHLTPMSNAEKSRLRRIPVPYDKKDFLEYLRVQFTKIVQDSIENMKDNQEDFSAEDIEQLKQGYKNAYEWGKVLMSPLVGPTGNVVASLEFDNEDDENNGNDDYGDEYSNFTYRTLSGLLGAAAVENNIDSIIDNWDQFCSPGKKDTAKLLIDNYKKQFETADNKANDAMKQADKQSVGNNNKYIDKIKSLKNK